MLFMDAKLDEVKERRVKSEYLILTIERDASLGGW
jgi:hypothetical protein